MIASLIAAAEHSPVLVACALFVAVAVLVLAAEGRGGG